MSYAMRNARTTKTGMTQPRMTQLRLAQSGVASTRLLRLAQIVLAFAAVFYSSFIIEAILGYPLDPARAFLSELAARAQPNGWVFSLTDRIAGILICCAIILVTFARTTRPRWRNARTWILGGLLLAGVATIADSLFPMDCAESLPQCLDLLAHSGPSSAHTIHSFTSTFAGAGFTIVAVGMIRLWWEERILGWGAVFAALSIFTLTVHMVEYFAGWPLGYTQRAEMLATVSMMLALSLKLPLVVRQRPAITRPRFEDKA